MFELFRVYETAKSEENKLLRKLVIRYTKKELRKSFFNKFYIDKIEIDKNLLVEFMQLYKSIGFTEHIDQNCKYPHIFLVDPLRECIEIRYYGFAINIQIVNDDEYKVDILFTPKNTNSLTTYLRLNVLNLTVFRPIILMAIYNYCVSYIYGFKSDLYIDDAQYIQRLYDLYI